MSLNTPEVGVALPPAAAPQSLAVLLARVLRRQRLAGIAARLPRFWLGLAALHLLLLLVSRLLGLLPPWVAIPETLLVVPALAVILALVFQPRPTPAAAARLLDARTGAKDLFLTATLINNSLGAYQQLVVAQAEQRAAGIRASEVVRCEWKRGAALMAASLAVLALGLLLLPQLDPFGREQQRRQLAQQRERLRESVKATKLQVELLAQKTASAATDPVKQAVSDLQQAFQAARPADKTGTFNRLNAEQKLLGELWRKTSELTQKDASNPRSSSQSFGRLDQAKTEQWKKDLQSGDPASVNKELRELQELEQKLAATTDPVRREELRQELMDRLQNLQEALGQQLNAPALNAALQRALEQLQMASQQGLSQEALQGLSESLQLSAEELAQAAKGLGDMQKLEDALKALQAAKRLHGVKPLDGSQMGECKNPGEYAALFNAMYAAACSAAGMGQGYGDGEGAGNGLGQGQGQGSGPRPHGDDSATTVFKTQQSASELQAGKMLLSWKTKGVSESGEAREQYRQAVDAVRQQAGEALQKEQIPMSYHGTVKSYFDSMKETAPAERPP